MPEVLILEADAASVLDRVAPDVFDLPLRPELVAEFLSDPRHHLAVAIESGAIVGFASAVHYVHPDKAAELWINEVGVAPGHRGRGLGGRLVTRLLELAGELDCRDAWVLTERDNAGAMALYRSIGGVERAGTVMFSLPPGRRGG